MKRDYETGSAEGVVYFTGVEVEKTPAHGMQTLFVTGLNDPSIIREQLHLKQEHIFFGANHSFDPASQKHSADYYEEWEKMITPFLEDGYWCSLDIPINAAEEFLEGPLVEFDRFIPQLRVPIPYVRQWNYNTMIKIDDKGFEESNPGVWCHSLHDLMDRSKFTEWNDYKNDKIVDDN
jgi:hypothetical protein